MLGRSTRHLGRAILLGSVYAAAYSPLYSAAPVCSKYEVVCSNNVNLDTSVLGVKTIDFLPKFIFAEREPLDRRPPLSGTGFDTLHVQNANYLEIMLRALSHKTEKTTYFACGIKDLTSAPGTLSFTSPCLSDISVRNSGQGEYRLRLSTGVGGILLSSCSTCTQL